MGFFKSDLEIVIRDLSKIMIFISIALFVPIIISLIYGEYDSIAPFLLTGCGTILASYLISKRFPSDRGIEFKNALAVVALSWILAAFLGSIPFMIILKMSFIDALFESVSAWTTTGLTVISNVEAIPKTLLFWRSFMQWLGGIGIVVTVVAGIFKTGMNLFLAEGKEEMIAPNVQKTMQLMWWIYIIYTAAGIVLLNMAGMGLFDAVNHTFTALATGGMSTKNLSIEYYNNVWIEIVLMGLMIAGSISFLTHFYIMRGNLGKVRKDPQMKYFFLMLIVAAIMLILVGHSLRSSAFQVVSAASGTGFQTSSLITWTDFSKSVLSILMIVGACAGSTAGGLKIFRVEVFAKTIYWNLRRIIMPSSTFIQKVGNKIVDDVVVKNIFLYISTYLLFLLIGSMVLMSLGFSGADSLLEVSSAQGNCGLTAGITSTSLHFVGKVMLIINMLIGRLEIWAFMVLVGIILIRR